MIQLQFTQGTDFGARAIEYFGHGVSVSHVDAVLGNGRLVGARSDEVGGAPAGVQVRDPAYTGNNKVIRVSIPCAPYTQADFYQFVLSQVGKPYDSLGIISFIVGRNWQDPQSWFCSELVAAGLQVCGYFSHKLAATSNKITPADLLLILSSHVEIAL